MNSEQKSDVEQRELEDLDRQAQEALDKLADKREELARRHQWAHGPFNVFDALPALAEDLSSWFGGRFNEVIPGIGHDPRALGYGKPGPSLPERDPLTQAK
jgi:hypothetical protein